MLYYYLFQAAGPKKKAAEHITEDKWLAKVLGRCLCLLFYSFLIEH
jgi:hypothetical protein